MGEPERRKVPVAPLGGGDLGDAFKAAHNRGLITGQGFDLRGDLSFSVHVRRRYAHIAGRASQALAAGGRIISPARRVRQTTL